MKKHRHKQLNISDEILHMLLFSTWTFQPKKKNRKILKIKKKQEAWDESSGRPR